MLMYVPFLLTTCGGLEPAEVRHAQHEFRKFDMDGNGIEDAYTITFQVIIYYSISTLLLLRLGEPLCVTSVGKGKSLSYC